MQSKGATVAKYLASLPADRRAALQAVRKVIQANLGKGFKEGMQYGMIGYCVPHSIYPAGYHCDPKQPLPFASLASQKNHISFSLMSVYLDSAEERWFKTAWQKTGKKLDMGRACVRFKRLEDVPLEVVGEAFARTSAQGYIERYEAVLATSTRPRAKKTAAKKPAARAEQAARGARRSKRSSR
jgi:Domain of unknown function (DU1801)